MAGIACSSSALTGQSGSVYYTPAGTSVCLRDFSDFPAGDVISVPLNSDFRVNDPVVFTEEDGGKIDGSLTAGDAYFVVAVASGTISVSATLGGAVITLAGDGGSGTADSVGGHINLKYDPFQAVCDVASFSIEISREELDVTTLPCGLGSGSTKFAAFRSTQAGYASATGTISLYFTGNAASLGQRMLADIMFRDQTGARVRLFTNTVADGSTPGEPDLAASSYIEGDISLTGVSLDVNPDDPQQGEVSFTVQNITQLFTTSLV